MAQHAASGNVLGPHATLFAEWIPESHPHVVGDVCAHATPNPELVEELEVVVDEPEDELDDETAAPVVDDVDDVVVAPPTPEVLPWLSDVDAHAAAPAATGSAKTHTNIRIM